MKKYDIMGHEMVEVAELRHVIRRLRKDIPSLYWNFNEEQRAMVHLAYNDVVRQLYLDELKAAKSPDEIRAILEMPGDFIVAKYEGKHKVVYFKEYENGEGVITNKAYAAMNFSYESKAREVAEGLGEGWEVYDMSKYATEDAKRLLDAIFGDDDDEEGNEV